MQTLDNYISVMNSGHALLPAEWIAASIVGSPRTSAPCPFLRRNFSLSKPVKSATLEVTALGLYECQINGRRVGDEVFSPGWTDYRHRVQYQSYDVTSLLCEGENVLGSILGDGWYCGFVAWQNRQSYGDRPLFLARLIITHQDDSTIAIGSDSSWKFSSGPIMQSDLLMGETYDARLELDSWSQPGYDDSRWLPVIVAHPNPFPELSPRIGPPVRRMAERSGDLVFKNQWHHIYDCRQNFAGRVRLKLKAARDTVVKLRFGEMLSGEGQLYTDNLREAGIVDYYICKGGEEETWESRFTFHGFRFVEVSGLAPSDSITLTGIVLHSDTPVTGSFSCSNPLLNQLQHNITWGQRSNFLEAPTDCPQRNERLGWTGDAQVFIRTACFNMNVNGFFHKWLRDMRDTQKPTGSLPPVVPDNNFTGLEDGGPAWSDALIICPWTHYLCYGDLSILAENYPMMKRFMEFVAKERCLGCIRSHPDVDSWGGFGDWLALDGSGITEGATPRDLIGTAFYANDAAIMARVSELLGHKAEAGAYTALHTKIVHAFRNRFVSPDGLVMSGTQTATVLALHFDLLPANSRANAAAELVRNIKKRDFHLATGFVGTPYLLDVLESTGYLDVAYKLLEQETFPSWLFPVKNGATTIWERWDGWTPEKGFQDKGMNSFNHYAYGAVGAWMYRSVAGLELDPATPGYRHIIFRPRPGGSITWAEAKLESIHGQIAIRWELKEQVMHVDISIPEGCNATFDPPQGFGDAESEYSAGKHSIVLEAHPAGR